MTPVPVSVVIAARDEGREIGECIASVSWAAEVIVVENDSTDDTIERARAAGATVMSHPFRTIGAQRNAAIERASHAWVLVVDADERGTPALAEAVRAVVANIDSAPAWRAPRRNFFLGREIRHGGWERDRPVRLFRRSLRYDERPVHEHVIVHGAVDTLKAPLLHTPYATLSEYFDKLHRYSRWWAEQHAARGRRASMLDLTLRPLARFFTMLVLRRGFLDGPHGVIIAVLGAMSVAAKYAQLWVLSHET
ncbi:MAG: glycosyltransferase family 2 protein [Gemmatimonadaceae bacterium]|nr:glycosyltransferase family 2 protein [Gemmatimonadaceae bacterium]